ncbi:23S rRNA (adenine(2503)-C(2))-methyltransferase RlmN [Limisphaera sp. VF-2]|uniref:23S rRNA (adenine(2503)-C(2))-methyltransferase RlmN n=1 Tax=Limisphaera sp. VF-2 TaxID=3400418 RepID=UPI0017728A8B|nr:23S rRNA (adenine(2503)-C(2))-methyltransferase RlmN [Limisphaera sp.]
MSVVRDIKTLFREELQAQVTAWGEPAYRADQVLEWLYRHCVTDWSAMTNVPRSLQQRLGEHFSLQTLVCIRLRGSADQTRKFLWRLPDGAFIESVLIPANPALYGEPADRHTLCVSTQVGCAYGCRFCASGLDGWKRNLQPHEIVEQVLAVERWHRTQEGSERGANRGSGRLVDNLVIMGMGEPLANYDNLMRALRILNAPWGGGIGARKITISTSGVVPGIRRLAEEPEQFRLAVSLHGATDAVRGRIMPVNRKYPLAELVAALEYYQKRKGRMLTFEYILIEGVNDSPDQVPPLAALARRLHAKVNLIPYNPVEGLEWRRPAPAACEAFYQALRRAGVTVTLRREKGVDIDAACGQLRLRTEREFDMVRSGSGAGETPGE